MNEKIAERFNSLLMEGKGLIDALPPSVIPTDCYGGTETIHREVQYSVDGVKIPKYQSWLSSAANLIHYVVGENGVFARECSQLMMDEELKKGIPSRIVQKMFGLLTAVKEELGRGMLG